MRIVVKQLPPDTGYVRYGANLDIGYYDQHQAHLHEHKSVLDEVWDEFPRLEQSQVRGALGLFLFTGDDVFAPIATLSGGEKQRISIARSLLKKSSVLLADEVTAALDAQTAHRVSSDILDLQGITRIVVTHTLEESLLRRYDKIFVLRGGRIEEAGSFADLMANKGYFYALFTVAQ